MKGLLQIASLCLIIGSTSMVQAQKNTAAQDHPLVGSYANSSIKAYYVADYDEYEVATGPTVKPDARPPMKKIEGKVTTITYHANTKTESVLKVHRNFMMALRAKGFKTVFTCSNKGCGPKFIPQLLTKNHRKSQYLKFDPWNTVARSANFRFWMGTLNKNGRLVYVTLVIKHDNSRVYPVQIQIDIVETKDMETGLVAVTETVINESIAESGKAVLDGIYFDHNKSTLKPESDKALREIANYLINTPAAKVFIVGHTDNKGSYDYNLKLSRSRAGSVVGALVSRYNIPRNRMRSIGVGEVAPVKSNRDESGRKKNRRVVMVLMGNS